MQITRHQLKTWPKYFWPVVRGEKTFELRKNDRGFKVGDYLDLLEYDSESQSYSGQNSLFTITYITDFQQQPGYVVMGIKPVVAGNALDSILGQVQQDLGGRVTIKPMSKVPPLEPFNRLLADDGAQGWD